MQLADLCVQMETNNDDENMGLENDNQGVQMEYENGDKSMELQDGGSEKEFVEQEATDADKAENEKIVKFMNSGCTCRFNKGKPCYTLFEESHYRSIRNSCAELDHDSLDLVVKAQIMAHINTFGNNSHCNAVFYHHSKKVWVQTSIARNYL